MKHQLMRVFGLLAGGLLLADAASATVTTISYYRLGEDDPGAVASGTADNPTTDIGNCFSLPQRGIAPTYDSSTGVSGSTLCMDFNGGGYASTNVIAIPTAGWGIECWVKASSTAPSYPSGGSGKAEVTYNGYTGASGMGIWSYSGGQFIGILGGVAHVGAATINPGVWTHLALVTTGTSTTLYVNGVAGTNTSTVHPTMPATLNFGIGADVGTGSAADYFAGSIDEVRVFSFASGAFTTNDLLLTNVPPTPTTTPPVVTSTVGALVNGTNFFVAGTAFSLGATGTGCGLSYQWQSNTVNLTGSNSATLYFANPQATNIGSNYTVVVSNAFYGAVTSAVFSVGVLPSTTSIIPLAYYRLGENDPGAANGRTADSTTIDLVGGNTLYQAGTAPTNDSTTGVPGSSLCLDVNGGGYTNGAAVPVPANWGIECWAKSTSTSQPATSGNGIIFANAYAYGNGGMAIFGYHDGTYMGLVCGVAHAGSNAIVPGVWTHLAMVALGGQTTFYVNGVATQAPVGAPIALPATSWTSMGVLPSPISDQFAGSIDEARIFVPVPGNFTTNDLLLSHVPPADVTVKSSLNPWTYGSGSVTFTATIIEQNEVNPIGTVTFYDGATSLGSGTLSGGVATVSVPNLFAISTSSPQTITAVYGGDANYPASTNILSGGQTANALRVTLTGSGTYNGTSNMAAANLSISNILAGDAGNLTLSGTATLSNVNVGTEPITSTAGLSLGGSAAPKYTLTGASGSVTVTAKALTVIGITDTASTVYNGLIPSAVLGGTGAFLTAEATGGSSTTTDGKPYTGNGDNVSPGGTAAGALAAKDAGSEPVTVTGVTVTGTGSGNCTATQQTGLTQTITAKALTMGGLTVPSSRPYNGTESAVVTGSPGTLTGSEAAGVGTSSDGKWYTGDGVSLIGAAIGTYDSPTVASASQVTFGGVSLNVGVAPSSDYTLTIQSPASAIITPASLSITANAQSKTYGTALSLGTSAFTTSPLQNSETVGALTLTASGGTAANAAVGAYTITPSAATGGSGTEANYNISYITNTLTVNPLTLILTEAYDGTTNTVFPGLLVSNAVSGDDVSVTTGSAGMASADIGTNAITSVGTLALGGTTASNYSLTGASVIVTPLEVTLTGTRPYDGANDAAASILTIVTNYDGANLTLSGSATLAGTSVGAQNISDFTGLTLGGAAATNYTLTGASGAVTITNSFAPFTITSSSLDVTGTNVVVCWQSVPGVVYNVLTNSSLASPQSWVAAGSPITATNTTTCFTLPGGTSSTNVFVVIKQ